MVCGREEYYHFTVTLGDGLEWLPVEHYKSLEQPRHLGLSETITPWLKAYITAQRFGRREIQLGPSEAQTSCARRSNETRRVSI